MITTDSSSEKTGQKHPKMYTNNEQHDPHQPYSAEDTNGHFPPATNGAGSAALHQQIDQVKLDDFVCVRCNDGFAQNETVVNSGGQVWHAECFVCAQCFQPFPDGIYFEFEGRKYCEHDFQVLYAPCCNKCNQLIIGRIIKAMNANWHLQCFICEFCNKTLADVGFFLNAGRALCRECNEVEKAAGAGKYVCHKCRAIIEDGHHIKFKGDSFHPYHFNCKRCGNELTDDAREIGGALFCLRCHDLMGIPLCGACHRPIEKHVDVVTPHGKQSRVKIKKLSICKVCGR